MLLKAISEENMETNITNIENNAEEIVVFDASSGISEEEQRIILMEIDGIASKNRLNPTKKDLNVKAKKKGVGFPIFVNIIAILLLAGGIYALYFLHQRDILSFQSSALYTGAERALIRDIRRETYNLLSLKDNEIAGFLTKLAEIDRQLQTFQQYMDRRLQEREAELRAIIRQEVEAEQIRLIDEELPEAIIVERINTFEEQREIWLDSQLILFRQQLEGERQDLEIQLQALKEEYSIHIAQLQRERFQILENARIKEENLQAQLMEKGRELSAMYEQNKINVAYDELLRLNNQQEQFALIEMELSGFYVSINEQVKNRDFESARNTLRAMVEFINTPSLQNIIQMQTRKGYYIASINILSELISDVLERTPSQETFVQKQSEQNSEYTKVIENLIAQNKALEETIAKRDQTIANFETERSQTLANINTNNTSTQTVNNLRTQNANLQRTIAERDSTINNLKTQNTTLQQTVTARDRNINELQSQNNALQRNSVTQTDTINSLRSQNASLQQYFNSLQSQGSNFQQTLAERDSTINSVRSQNASLQQTLVDRENVINTIRAQNATLQQIVTTHENTISDLRSQNASLSQTLGQLREAIRVLGDQ